MTATARAVAPLVNSDTTDATVEQITTEAERALALQKRKRWCKGVLCLLGLVVTWVITVQLTNMVMKGSDYDHPLFVAALDGMFFVIFGGRMPFRAVRYGFRAVTRKLNVAFGATESEPLLESCITRVSYGSNALDADAGSKNDKLDGKTAVVRVKSVETEPKPLRTHNIVLMGAVIAFIYFICGACATTALKYTSGLNETVLSTTSSLFSLLLGVLFRVEKFSWSKLVAIVCSICGICLVTFMDRTTFGTAFEAFNLESTSLEVVLGNFLCILAAMAYSGFLVLMKWMLGRQQKSKDCDKIMYTTLGLSTIAFVPPLLFLADIFGVEQFGFPHDPKIFAAVLFCGLLNAVSDYCASVASLLTSPLVTSLSLSTGIPLSMICDSIFFHTVHISPWYYAGILMIFASLIFTSAEDEDESDQLEGI